MKWNEIHPSVMVSGVSQVHEQSLQLNECSNLRSALRKSC